MRVHDLRGYTEDRHRSVDDEPYGGGGGMVMTAPPWIRAVRACRRDRERRSRWRVLLSPQGARLDDAKVRELAGRGDLVLLCGRYEGIDERVRRDGGRRGGLDRRLRAVGRRAAGDGADRGAVAAGAGGGQAGGLGGAGQLPGRPARLPALHAAAGGRGAGGAGGAASGDHAAIRAGGEREALRATREKRPDLLGAEVLALPRGAAGSDEMPRDTRQSRTRCAAILK